MMSWLHVHTALAPGPKFKGRSSHGPYGDVVEELDWGVGQVMEALLSLGQEENTLVYFTSDNGGHVEEEDHAGRRAGGFNGVLKGGRVWKLVFYEPGYLPNTQRCFFICQCYDAILLDPPPIYELTSDPGERRPLLAKDLPEYRVLVKVMLAALQRHKDSIVPVENMYSLYKLLWRPWNQPVCHFPYFKCRDEKFVNVFHEDDDK